MAGEKYWKISRVVMVITSENIGFVQYLTITTSDIFQILFYSINTTSIHYHMVCESPLLLNFKSGKISVIIFLGPLLMELHFLFMNAHFCDGD